MSSRSVDKVNQHRTYLNSSNYWAPLSTILEENEDEDEDKSSNIIEYASLTSELPNSNKVNESMVVDSGATSHFATETIDLPRTGETSNKQVRLPDGNIIRGSQKAVLPCPNLPKNAAGVDVLPNLQKSLFSVGEVADEGYTTVFHPRNEGVTIHREGTITITTSEPAELQGWRAETGLWEFDPKAPNHQAIEITSVNNNMSSIDNAFNAYTLPSTPMAIRFLHAAAGYPIKSTWLAAIKAGNFVTWPMLTTENVNKHYPESNETDKGHMKMQRMNVRSTKKVKDSSTVELTNSPMPKKEDVYIYVFNAHDTVYTDQTGGFPITSSKGNKYVMVMCEVDGNYIDAEPMKSKSTESMVQTYLTLWKRLTSSKVITPKLHILDNEAPEPLREVIKSHCKMQLVPPDTHRSNLAERAIQTFKNHLIAILSGVDESFPMQLWDRLIPQAVLTLNLLHQSHANPNISAYHYIHGPFDYNATPLGPLGCAVQILNSPERRQSWEERSLDGWYIGTSLDHYRCHRVYVKNTRDERISNTINFKHRYITQPTVTPIDMAVKAIKDLTKVLKVDTKQENEEYAALKRLENMISNKLTVKTKAISGRL